MTKFFENIRNIYFKNSFKHSFTGKLRISTVNNMEFMPFDTENKSDECFIPAKQMPQFQCFVGGMN
jgi:hypothetical protein